MIDQIFEERMEKHSKDEYTEIAYEHMFEDLRQIYRFIPGVQLSSFRRYYDENRHI